MARERIEKTLVEDVLLQLRRDILSGRLRPGTRLKMNAVSSELGVSLSVLREALNRLVEQELVTLEPQVGFRVVNLSPEALLDLTTARVHIEVAALQASILRGDVQWEAAVVAAHHALTRTPMLDATEPGSLQLSPTWDAAHTQFHRSLIAACGSRTLLDIATSLREASELYRQWSGPLGIQENRDIIAEHQAICAAALDRDAELAARLLAEHIERTTDLLLTHADDLQPERTLAKAKAV